MMILALAVALAIGFVLGALVTATRGVAGDIAILLRVARTGRWG